MKNLIVPEEYKIGMSPLETQIAINEIKKHFENKLERDLSLIKVKGPLFVTHESGLNDNLNGVEEPVSFSIKENRNSNLEIVHSLAKWKRYALQQYNLPVGRGIYTDMQAIRSDEETDNIHSIYVDQWDWEMVISEKDRSLKFLQKIADKIYELIRETDIHISDYYNLKSYKLPDKIKYMTTQELEDMYPGDTPKEREYKASKCFGAIFVEQIGDFLKSGRRHDNRSPDYDDWKLNGDIIIYYPLLDIALELSSMGIRVDKDTLVKQLEKAKCLERLELTYQKKLLNNELPLTIGGRDRSIPIIYVSIEKSTYWRSTLFDMA